MKKQTKIHLETIADCLRSGHASLFVGAGFSKNAKVLSGGKLPPNWNELGDIFYKTARKKNPADSDRAYANVLRLAEEVKCMYDKDYLTALIKEAINDQNLVPSELHEQLLSLPWKDIFTTNYDSLLEKSIALLKKKGECAYTTIRKDKEMGSCFPPFLIKLHGDFSIPKSIVITEEDYRKYPKEHQAMIGHIQHTIMFETLVLIGFSGNDPNFIQWLGWVKDALSDNKRKVYLLTVDDVSDSMIKTFKEKNVIVVDLKHFAGKSSLPYDDLTKAVLFIDKCITKRNEEASRFRKHALEWGRSNQHNEDIKSTLISWQKERKEYPGWLIMPREKRENWANVGSFTLSLDQVKQLESPFDILFLDLFNWRIERCLYPIENDWASIYLYVLDKYKPFESGSNHGIINAWVNLKLSLLRLYRQEGWTKKWNDLNDELTLIYNNISRLQQCRYSYEKALMSIYQNDYDKLEIVLQEWPNQKEDPYWDIRRGAIWAEFFSIEKGAQITKRALDNIDEHFQLSENECERFFWGSRSVHAHTVWNCISQANFSFNDDVADYARYIWNDLRPYDDIWFEREFFDANLKPIEQASLESSKTASFFLGNSSTTTSYGTINKCCRIAYAYFLYFEESAIPIHLPFLTSVTNNTHEKALSLMTFCSPAIAESFMMRSGEPKMVAAVFNRRYLDGKKSKDVTIVYNRYLLYLSNLLDKDDGTVINWILNNRKMLGEILSRLCVKASYEARVKTFEFIDKIFRNNNSIQYLGIDKLLFSLFSTLSFKQREDTIPMLANMTVARDRSMDNRLEPFSYLKAPEELEYHIDPTLANNLFDQLGKADYIDKAIIYRLLFMLRCGVLNNEQKKDLSNIVWKKRDEHGFPSDSPLSKFVYLTLPHPDDVDPEALLKTYFSKSVLPKMGKGLPVGFIGGNIPLLNEIKGTMNKGVVFSWDSNLMNYICSDIITLWDSDKERLKDNRVSFGLSIKDELELRISGIESVLVSVIASHISLINSDNTRNLSRMIHEFNKYGIPSLRLRVAFNSIIDSPLDLKKEMNNQLGSSNEKMIDDGVYTILFLERKEQDVTDFVVLMSEYFRSNSPTGRKQIIWGIDQLIKNEKYIGNESIKSNIVIGIKRIWDESVISTTDSELVANDKLYERKAIAKIVRRLLASDLNEYEKSVLMECKSYYESDDTFGDIRIAYLSDL